MKTNNAVVVLLVVIGLLAWLFFSTVWPTLRHYTKSHQYIRTAIAAWLDVTRPGSTIFGTTCRVLQDMAHSHPLTDDHPPCIKYGFIARYVLRTREGTYRLQLEAAVSQLRRRPADALMLVIYDERSQRWYFATLGEPVLVDSADTEGTVEAKYLGLIDPAPLEPPQP